MLGYSCTPVRLLYGVGIVFLLISQVSVFFDNNIISVVFFRFLHTAVCLYVD